MGQTLCKTCGDYANCRKTCKPVNAILWKDNNVYERHYEDSIVVFPPKHEVHFSAFADYKVDEFESTDFPWSSGDYKLRQTTVFIEKFFNKTTTSELAERFGVKESVISTMYKNCLDQIEKIVGLLDLRASGIKNLKPDRFTDDEKMFLLVYVFRFNAAEVAQMFHHSANYISLKLSRMADKYAALFAQQNIKSKVSSHTGNTVEENLERMAV